MFFTGSKKLFDRLLVDQARLVELAIDILRELGVLLRVGRVPVVELDVEAVEVLLAPPGDLRDECSGDFPPSPPPT